MVGTGRGYRLCGLKRQYEDRAQQVAVLGVEPRYAVDVRERLEQAA